MQMKSLSRVNVRYVDKKCYYYDEKTMKNNHKSQKITKYQNISKKKIILSQKLSQNEHSYGK